MPSLPAIRSATSAALRASGRCQPSHPMAASAALRGCFLLPVRRRCSVVLSARPWREEALLSRCGVHSSRLDRRPLTTVAQASTSSTSIPGTSTSPADLAQFLATVRAEHDAGNTESLVKLEAADALLQGALARRGEDPRERIKLLQELASLGALPGRPFAVAKFFVTFLESYADELHTLRDGETIAQRASELREVLKCFHLAGVNTERLRAIYSHIENDFPRIEAAGALLPMPEAIRLCHLMLSTDLSSAPAVIVLLRATLREPLMHFEDDAVELRLLKMVEMLLRVDFLTTQEQLPRDVVEYLSVVRSLRYYDRDLRRDTALSYQLAFFLRKHKFPAKRQMLGPYVLKVCDPKERVNFEPVEERAWRRGMREDPPARKRRHLEAIGWRHIEVHASNWRELETYEAKAAHVRKLLKEHDMLDP